MLDSGNDKSNITDIQFIHNRHTRHKRTNLDDLKILVRSHHFDFRAGFNAAIHNPYINNNTFVRVIMRIENKRF
ncbi:hypothetical protein D3C78_711250 [compost metagenome]